MLFTKKNTNKRKLERAEFFYTKQKGGYVGREKIRGKTCRRTGYVGTARVFSPPRLLYEGSFPDMTVFVCVCGNNRKINKLFNSFF